MTMPFALRAQGIWPAGRGENMLDGGAPFYGTYRTSDDKWVALGAIEEPFWQQLGDLLELDEATKNKRMDRQYWPQIKRLIAEKIASRTRQHWEEVFEGSDACFAPILSMEDAPNHPHNINRSVFRQVEGIMQPAPAPRYDGMAATIRPTDMSPVDYGSVLADWNQ
jgi:alpha-methylacyl-CoA racemase